MPRANNLTWIDKHFENVVRPMLIQKDKPVNISTDMRPELLESYFNKYGGKMFAQDLYLDGLFFVWAVLKEKAKVLKKPIFLPGRDAYIFAVLSEIDRTPAIVRPDISTVTSPFIAEDYTHTVMADSGYNGTCAFHMGIKDFLLVSCTREHKQIYRGILPGTREDVISFAPAFEGCPKYWERALMRGDSTNRSYYWHTRYANKDGQDTPEKKALHFENNPELMTIGKGSPIEFRISVWTEVIVQAFYLHRWIASHYTPTAIEKSQIAAAAFMKKDDDWKRFLVKRERGIL